MIKRSDFGRPLAIHASREIEDEAYERGHRIAPELRAFIGGMPTEWYRLSRITSAVIAVATIDHVIDLGTYDPAELPDDQRRWFFGPIGYVLRDVRVLATPVACRGWQGFWYLTPKEQRERGQVSAVERAVQEQVTR